MKAYEIHTFQKGAWKMDSVFDDRDLAMNEAKKVDDANRYSGVRVIEEIYDESTDETFTRIIFRGGSVDKNAKEQRKKAKPAAKPKTSRGTGKEPVRKSKGQPKEQQKNKLMLPLILLFILVVVGLGGLFGLNMLSQMK